MATAQHNLLSATHTRKLNRFAEVTGCSIEEAVAHAVSNFLSDEAPVFMDRARKDAKAGRGTAPKKARTVKKNKVMVRSRTSQGTTLADVLNFTVAASLLSLTPEEEACIQDFKRIQEEDDDSDDSFSQSEVDKGISYLDEEFNA